MKMLCAALFTLISTVGYCQQIEDRSASVWGTSIDPDGDSEIVYHSMVTIAVPGTPHDLSAELNRMNAPRILRDVTGNFIAEVTVKGAFSPGVANIAGRTAYNGAGLVLMQDEKNYIRLERAVLVRGGQSSHYANFELRVDGQLVRFGTPSDFSIDPTKDCSLKLERREDKILGFVRQGDNDWHTLQSKEVMFDNLLKVGIAALNASDAKFEVSFLGFEVSGSR